MPTSSKRTESCSIRRNLHRLSNETVYCLFSNYCVKRQSIFFYRATLCVSAVFTVARCPSVRPSLWRIVSRQLKISSNFLFVPVALSFYFFDPERQYPIPQATPSEETQNTRGSEIFCDFRQKSPSISETIRDRPMVAIEC